MLCISLPSSKVQWSVAIYILGIDITVCLCYHVLYNIQFPWSEMTWTKRHTCSHHNNSYNYHNNYTSRYNTIKGCLLVHTWSITTMNSIRLQDYEWVSLFAVLMYEDYSITTYRICPSRSIDYRVRVLLYTDTIANLTNYRGYRNCKILLRYTSSYDE